MKVKALFFLCLVLPILGIAQNDTIRVKNNNVIVGEIKSLTRGVLTMETPYSDKDFQIEYDQVIYMKIQRKCVILLTQGRRRFGNLTTNDAGRVVITLEDGTKEEYDLNEIVILNEVKDVFWQRISANIDLSFNLSKANNLTQFVIGGGLNYMDEVWQINGNVNLLNSDQDNSDRIKRNDAQLEFVRLLQKKWYLLGDMSYLANTEQALKGRFKPSVGAGRFLVNTNKLYFGLSLGYAYNIETYFDPVFDKTSSEAFLRGSLNLFDFDDIDLETNINISPSLSESGRVRVDYDLNFKYDLPLDFYIKLGFTLNYDNQPASGGNETDYIFTTGFGWEFN